MNKGTYDFKRIAVITLVMCLMPVFAFFITYILFQLTIFSWSWWVVMICSIGVSLFGMIKNKVNLAMFSNMIFASSIAFYYDYTIDFLMECFPILTFENWGALAHSLLGLSILIYLVNIIFYFVKREQGNLKESKTFYLLVLNIWSLIINSMIIFFFIQLSLSKMG